MAFTIGVAGKGGTGKTTIAGLIIRCLKGSSGGPILAVDADPNSNLAETVGLKVERTIGSALEEFLDSKMDLSPGTPKQRHLEYKLHKVLIEDKKIDLLVMGRPEGSGCYCYPNLILRKYLDMLMGNYAYLVIDNEAGMEHLSRRTTRDLDILLLVSDPTIKGLRAAKRIRNLAFELKLKIGGLHLVIDRAPGQLDSALLEEIERQHLRLLGTIPNDSLISEYDLSGRPLIDLPEDSIAVKAVNNFMKEIIQEGALMPKVTRR
ncbi:AAA family ATPase [candidate division NPL-UPA2 bacterium]|nr:AAA family ATPase [candidate division NPL-UPA2 bacterium]